jgi:hypothetical protein
MPCSAMNSRMQLPANDLSSRCSIAPRRWTASDLLLPVRTRSAGDLGAAV